MAGTDSKHPSAGIVSDTAPAVILIDPQLGENIGMVARAMLNCGLTDLRLVRPRDGWPNPAATSASSGAITVIENARLFETTAEAVADLQAIYATTARLRGMDKRVLTPRAAAREMRRRDAEGIRSGILFGKESKGLHNDDVALSEAVVTAPLNPAFSSLNLAQGVLLIGYEWHVAIDETPSSTRIVRKRSAVATKEELIGFFEHLEDELDKCGFFTSPDKRPRMIRNLRNIFLRADLTDQEVRTLRGVVAGLTRAWMKQNKS